MRTFLATFALAATISTIVTPLARRLAFRVGAVAVPGGRHVHQTTIPRLGGIAIYVALLAPLAALYFVQSAVADVFRNEIRRAAVLFVGGTIMCVLGAVDDTRGIRAIYKFYAQIAVSILAFAFGFRIEAISLPLVGEFSMGIFGLPVTVLWIVGIINAVNLIDGLDGLAAGVAFFAGLTSFVVAYISGSVFVGLVMAALLGAIIGFLFYNFNPARIFMGDSGSYFIGYVLATTSLVGAIQKASTAISLLVPVLALGIPIVDTLFAIVRRYLERRPLFAPDRSHIHHRLLALGITHRRAVLIIYGVCVVFTIASIAIALGHLWQAGVALVAASAVLIGLVRFVGYFEYIHLAKRQQARLRSRETELLRRAFPSLPQALVSAHDDAEIWQALEIFIKESDIAYFETFRMTEGSEEVLLHKWNPKYASNTIPDLVASRYPIGREGTERAHLRFGWQGEFGIVTPQNDILLQLCVDLVERNLSRVRSALAPKVEQLAAGEPVIPSSVDLSQARPTRL